MSGAGPERGDGSPQSDSRTPDALRRLALVFVILLVVISLARASASRKVGGDFLRYHRAGRLVATGREDLIYDATALRKQVVYAEERAAERAERGEKADRLEEMEFKYDPSFAVFMAPFGALPPRTGWTLWGGWNALMVGLTFAAAWSLARLPWKWSLLPFLVLAHKVNSNINLGQINPTAICAATVAMWFAARPSANWSGVAAGVTAAFGTAVKYMPFLVAPYLGARGLWKGFAAFVAAVVFFFLGLPALVFGPSKAWELYWQHKEIRAKFFTGAAPEDLPGHSIKSFLYRVFGGTHYLTGSGEDRVDLDVSVAKLPPEFLKWTVIALSVLLVAAAVCAIVARRGESGARTPLRTALETGLVLSTVTLVSPEARAPHYLYLALPLCALLAGIFAARRGGWRCARLVTGLAVGATFLLQTDSESMFGYAAHWFAAYCALGWANLAVFAALLILLREERARNGGAVPAAAAAPALHGG